MITYLSPVSKFPVGGIKVLYAHADLLAQNGFESCVFHPENRDFACTWFAHSAKMRTNDGFVAGTDFVVIPEVWAARYAGACRASGIAYAIFVQNGYQITPTNADVSASDLNAAYEQAAFIMSISEDTSEMISFLYPNIPQEKILRLFPHVSDAFQPGDKSKIISFMPRKLRDHARMLYFILEQTLPQGWRIMPIEGQDENGVARILAETSIFLSLSDQEGCPLPPLEAALSGAMVVGYTGEGAREYFRAPNFQPVAYGDYRAFVREVRRGIDQIEAGLLNTQPFLAGISELRKTYSRENELRHLRAFAARVQSVMKNGQA